jgi:hypothetical protein
MPASLKFKLAIRVETAVVTCAGAAFFAGINQAAVLLRLRKAPKVMDNVLAPHMASPFHAPSSKPTTGNSGLQIIRGSELLSASCSGGQAPAKGRLTAPLLLGNSQ